MRNLLVIFLALTLAAVSSAQSSVTLYFHASSTNVDSGAVASIFNNFEVDSIVSFANSLPNSNGMDNAELAHLRAMSVLDVADSMGVLYACKVRSTVVAGNDAGNRKVIIYISPKPNSPLAEAVEKSMNRMNAVQRMTWAADNADDFYNEWESMHDIEHSEVRAAPVESIRLWRVNVSPDSAHVSSLISEVSVLDRQAPANLFNLDIQDQAVRAKMISSLDTVTNHISKSMIINEGINKSKQLRRKMRLMLHMWARYDAKPSARKDREGARLDNYNELLNSGTYAQAANWTKAGRELKREVIEKYGDQIPWLGWDKKAYREYWETHSVFEDKEEVVTTTNPLAKKMNYSPLTDKERAKIKKQRAREKAKGLRQAKADDRRLKRVKWRKKWTSCIVAAKRALGLID